MITLYYQAIEKETGSSAIAMSTTSSLL